MKYLLMIAIDEKRLEALPQGEMDALVAEHFALDDALAAAGRLVATEALEGVGAATTVRVREGRTSVTDGPYAETKEQLGGFYLVDVPDLDEALRVAARIPSARLGAVEVRPVMELQRP